MNWLDWLYEFNKFIDPGATEAEWRQRAQEEYDRAGGFGIRTNQYYLQRAIGAGVTLTGVRNTLSFMLRHTERERLNTTSGVLVGDFAEFDYIETRSASVALMHRLTGTSTLNGSIVRSKSEGEGVSNRDVDRLLFSIGITRRLSPDTTAGLSYRRNKATGTDDYTENAISATLGMRF